MEDRGQTGALLRQWVQTIEWKQTDGRTDGRTDATIASPSRLTRSVKMSVFVGHRNLQDDFENYEASVKKLNEESQQQQQQQQQLQQQQQHSVVPGSASVAPPVDDAMCQICHKTKFADGVGNQCHYCGLRSCSRCGTKAALRSDKVRV